MALVVHSLPNAFEGEAHKPLAVHVRLWGLGLVHCLPHAVSQDHLQKGSAGSD